MNQKGLPIFDLHMYFIEIRFYILSFVDIGNLIDLYNIGIINNTAISCK